MGMQKEAKQAVKRRDRRPDLVKIAFAEEPIMARHFQKILLRDNIHAVLRAEPEKPEGFRIALWVPRRSWDRAARLLQSENALDSFYEALIEPTDVVTDAM
jgi:hypothetical protein